MRKKKAGALFMDFEISPEDRIGGASQRGRKAKPVAKARKPKKEVKKVIAANPSTKGTVSKSD